MKRVSVSIPATSLLFLLLFFMTPVQTSNNEIKSLQQTGKAFASIARAVSPSVVFIQVEGKAISRSDPRYYSPFGDGWPFGEDFLNEFFGDRFRGFQHPKLPKDHPKIMGQGSGFIFTNKQDSSGDKSYILTNYHVVKNADNIQVTLKDGRKFYAEITGSDPQSDLAVLAIKATDIPPLVLGNSSSLEVGEWVVAIGNPFGLSHSLTVGVVSAIGRNSLGLNDYEDFIQTDAAINPGNSGGPLVNLNSEVVGINTAIFSRSGGYMGIGFAVPIDLAKSIAQQLTASGKVTRGYLGLVIQDLSLALAESFGLDGQDGILISQVIPDSPADEAGLKQGDIITAYQDKAISDVGTFRNLVAMTAPGSKEAITIIRNSKTQAIQVKIGKQSKTQKTAAEIQSSEELGLHVESITPYLARKYDVTPGRGVVVTRIIPGSVAAMAGIESGSVILQVNRKDVDTAGEFKRAIDKSRSNKSVLLLVEKDHQQRYLVLSWR
ncbi:DegQ family serine endoprotease [Thalassomonas actiniarum]|uniref:DegQ family serine endoprotease n=1 Tax=Thalassomonas actiniarum TaxID=485447 RepID=A0AAE9YWH6_9GAMM|nr:DegQ family serine endoprotease [Thalassomonas actiniarum]WDE01654.1 DegQ family serine endoprotease [Thalassomonas actiniarum]